MNDSYRILKKMKEKKQQRFAMATIIAVDGSTYRHPGAKMLIGEDDSQYGTISAGCLEEDLAYHAREIINHRQPKTVIYDLRSEDDLSWGQGAGCNGSIRFMWSLMNGNISLLITISIWPEVESVLNNGSKVASAKRVSDDDAQRVHLFYTDNGAVLGDAETGLKEKIIPELKRFLISGRKIELIRLADIEGEFLLELYEPREQLYIFGAGPDVEPIARLASHLDFFVTIIDPKTSRCNAEIFPTADQLILSIRRLICKKITFPKQAMYSL